VLRAAAPGLIACLAPAGLLGPAGCVALLGVSSLLSAWSIAGNYTLIADLLLADQRVAGNTVFGLAGQPSLLIGPAVAGVLAAVAGPAPRGRGDRRAVRRWPVWPAMTGIVLGWGSPSCRSACSRRSSSARSSGAVEVAVHGGAPGRQPAGRAGAGDRGEQRRRPEQDRCA
jgi:hypothetical protein